MENTVSSLCSVHSKFCWWAVLYNEINPQVEQITATVMYDAKGHEEVTLTTWHPSLQHFWLLIWAIILKQYLN